MMDDTITVPEEPEADAATVERALLDAHAQIGGTFVWRFVLNDAGRKTHQVTWFAPRISAPGVTFTDRTDAADAATTARTIDNFVADVAAVSLRTAQDEAREVLAAAVLRAQAAGVDVLATVDAVVRP